MLGSEVAVWWTGTTYSLNDQAIAPMEPYVLKTSNEW